MIEQRDIQSRLDKCKDYLNDFLKKFKDNEVVLKEYYVNTHQDREKFVSDDDFQRCEESEFKDLFAEDISYLERQSSFIERIMGLNIVQQNKFSKQMESLINECVDRMNNAFEDEHIEDLLYDLTRKVDFSIEYYSIEILSQFSECPSNIVLIGGNGSGKSSLAKTLKGVDRENISVIPAQKTLYFSLNDMSMLSARKKDMEELLLENSIDKSKHKNDIGYFQFQNNQFTKLIVAMREQYTEYLMLCEEKQEIADINQSIFGILRKIFNITCPDIKLCFKTQTDDYFCCEKEGQAYHVNALSEGEKAIIYYSISVLMAKKDSFIIVDEPETYLNPSIANVLWDLLIQERQDCQFVFITHSVDFVLARSDAQIAWIKTFNYPNKWEFEFLDDSFSLPKVLLTEVLGSKKPILFCEGDDKTSLDYKVYQALFEEYYTVIPVGGHKSVIGNCDMISQAEWLDLECKGVIDGDNFPENKIEGLRSKNIEIIPFNEIEMFLLSDEMIQHMMDTIYPLEKEEKLEVFKKKFWEDVVNQKNEIALNYTKCCVDEYLQREKIDHFKTIEDIETDLSSISNFNVKKIYNNRLKKIEDIIRQKDYKELLKICNLKKAISKGLANRYLDSNYEEKAIEQIKNSNVLKCQLREKYFTSFC